MIGVSLIAAMAENGVIGRDNQLPWRLPADLQHFKKTTMGKPVVMGRKTFDSIGRALPGRLNIVVTRQPDWAFEGVASASSLEHALAMAQSNALDTGKNEIMVIGGAELYKQALPYANKLYLTVVHADVDGDAYFPKVTDTHWHEENRVRHFVDEQNDYDYSFVEMCRIPALKR